MGISVTYGISDIFWDVLDIPVETFIEQVCFLLGDVILIYENEYRYRSWMW